MCVDSVWTLTETLCVRIVWVLTETNMTNKQDNNLNNINESFSHSMSCLKKKIILSEFRGWSLMEMIKHECFFFHLVTANHRAFPTAVIFFITHRKFEFQITVLICWYVQMPSKDSKRSPHSFTHNTSLTQEENQKDFGSWTSYNRK